MKNKLLIVYNTCGISGRDNTDYYIFSLKTLLNQTFKNCRILVSSCLNTRKQREKIISVFGSDLSYNNIDEKLPVNVTFNHSIEKGREYFGDFEGYMYVDSGIYFQQNNFLEELFDLYKSGPYGMCSTRTTTDSGSKNWFGKTEEELFRKNNFIVPIGKAFNLHSQIFHPKLLEYYGRLVPDIFASYCTESTFTFLCAALKMNWVVAKDIKVEHIWSMDGASSGFNPGGIICHVMPIWQHLFRSPRTMEEIITDSKGIRSGFGYEEYTNILMHDETQFDKNGFCKNEELKDFIRDNLFLPQSALDYDEIDHTFIGC